MSGPPRSSEAASLASSFGAGVVFALGLLLAGMTDPSKVAAFLDVTGAWDPSLALVMVGAIVVHMSLIPVVRRLGRPYFAEEVASPPTRRVDAALVGGAILFGVGWGLSGYCPGPMLVALPTLSAPVLTMAAAVIVGTWVHDRLFRGWGRSTPPSPGVTPPARDITRTFDDA